MQIIIIKIEVGFYFMLCFSTLEHLVIIWLWPKMIDKEGKYVFLLSKEMSGK